MVICICQPCEVQLSVVVEACGLVGSSLGLGESWQKHPSKDADDGYDDQQFDQCKSS